MLTHRAIFEALLSVNRPLKLVTRLIWKRSRNERETNMFAPRTFISADWSGLMSHDTLGWFLLLRNYLLKMSKLSNVTIATLGYSGVVWTHMLLLTCQQFLPRVCGFIIMTVHLRNKQNYPDSAQNNDKNVKIIRNTSSTYYV